MTSRFAMKYIRMRMRETGLGAEYFLKWRHFVLAPDELREIDAGEDFFLIVNEFPNVALDLPPVRVESEFGIWDYDEAATNELIHEHRGKITLKNSDPTQVAHFQMIQVIPKNRKKDGDN